MNALTALLWDDDGSTITEYGVLMASFTILSIAGLIMVSNSANNQLGSIFASTTAMNQCPPGTAGC